jgi:Holliday junction resolvasome RuvABC DNA-binding subunit
MGWIAVLKLWARMNERERTILALLKMGYSPKEVVKMVKRATLKEVLDIDKKLRKAENKKEKSDDSFLIDDD